MLAARLLSSSLQRGRRRLLRPWEVRHVRHASSSTSTTAKTPPTTSSPSITRLLIGLFGEMNAGKSTCINALTQQTTAIVDSTPGTTSDVKAALLELHGLGPVKLLDTAGVDDVGELGGKKRKKALQALKEVDVAVVVVDPFTKLLCLKQGKKKGEGEGGDGGKEGEEQIKHEKCRADPASLTLITSLVHEVARKGRQAMLVFNIKEEKAALIRETRGATCEKELIASIEAHIHRELHTLIPSSSSSPSSLSSPSLLPSFTADFSLPPSGKALSLHLVHTLKDTYTNIHTHETPLIPPQYHDQVVFLNIPMDAETPQGRLLRPQALIQEYCLRHFIPTLAYRMDLAKARSTHTHTHTQEKKRFVEALSKVCVGGGCLVVTDSQAIDVVDPWTRCDEHTYTHTHTHTHTDPWMRGVGEEERGGERGVVCESVCVNEEDEGKKKGEEEGGVCKNEKQEGKKEEGGGVNTDVDVTTFSIAMINYMSGGKLQVYVDGLEALLGLEEGDKVLIAEACNHMRIPEACDDIGLVQIPRKLKEFYPSLPLHVHHAYGREFPSEELRTQPYKLVIHCGGCMLDKQKIRARMEDCLEANVAMTNYGLLLAFAASPQAFIRAVKPFGVCVPERLRQYSRTRMKKEKENEGEGGRGQSCDEHQAGCVLSGGEK